MGLYDNYEMYDKVIKYYDRAHLIILAFTLVNL